MFFIEIQEKFLYLPIFKQNQWFCLQGNISFLLKIQGVLICLNFKQQNNLFDIAIIFYYFLPTFPQVIKKKLLNFP